MHKNIPITFTEENALNSYTRRHTEDVTFFQTLKKNLLFWFPGLVTVEKNQESCLYDHCWGKTEREMTDFCILFHIWVSAGLEGEAASKQRLVYWSNVKRDNTKQRHSGGPDVLTHTRLLLSSQLHREVIISSCCMLPDPAHQCMSSLFVSQRGHFFKERAQMVECVHVLLAPSRFAPPSVWCLLSSDPLWRLQGWSNAPASRGFTE